jgi:chemotaxis response regulator CheB
MYITDLSPKTAHNRTVETDLGSLAGSSSCCRDEPATIGAILSGTATDGTLGLDAIKADGRITLAQDESARDASMPCGASRGLHPLAGEHCERPMSRVASKMSLRSAPLRARF